MGRAVWVLLVVMALGSADASAQEGPAEGAAPAVTQPAVDGQDAAPVEGAALAEGEVPAEGAVPAEGEAPAEGEVPVEPPVEEGEVIVEELPSPWRPGLITSMLALSIGGASAVLGIWVDRDKSRPASFALAMSFLISAAVSVGLFQSYLDAQEGIQRQADLDRMMGMVSEIAENSGDPKLAELVRNEGGDAAATH